MRTNLFSYLLGSENRKKIVQTLLEFPQRQWTCSSLEEAAKLSHATVFRIITELNNFGLLKQYRLSRKMVIFELVPSPILERIKAVLGAEKEGFKEIAKEFVNQIRQEKLLAVILYGSVAENRTKAGSDIDLLVIVSKNNPKIQKFITDQAAIISLKYNQTLSPIIIAKKEFLKLQKRRDKFILNALAGEMLYGKTPL